MRATASCGPGSWSASRGARPRRPAHAAGLRLPVFKVASTHEGGRRRLHHAGRAAACCLVERQLPDQPISSELAERRQTTAVSRRAVRPSILQALQNIPSAAGRAAPGILADVAYGHALEGWRWCSQQHRRVVTSTAPSRAVTSGRGVTPRARRGESTSLPAGIHDDSGQLERCGPPYVGLLAGSGSVVLLPVIS